MPHVEQQSHGCATLASKHANHLTTSKVRAPLLRVHTTLYDARTNDRETQCNRKHRTRSPLNFKHAQKSDVTAGERKIACNGSDSSCNVGEPSCECQKAGSQSVLKWSCANCERGLTTCKEIQNTCTKINLSIDRCHLLVSLTPLIHCTSCGVLASRLHFPEPLLPQNVETDTHASNAIEIRTYPLTGLVSMGRDYGDVMRLVISTGMRLKRQ